MLDISADQLRHFTSDLFTRAGFAPTDAQAMSDLLVWANLRGVDSHGVLRVPRYIEMLSLGLVRATYEMDVVHRFGAICVIDAGKAPGAVAMNRAVTEASVLAEQFGLGWCSVRRTSHAGAIGYFVQQLAAEGKIGIAMTASKPLMSYFGARGEALSTNPLAISIPQSDGRPPITLDMSTAAVALGKILAAKDTGRSIPKGWGVDQDGVDTTDPQKVAAVLPMAGAKGSGLSLMIEFLCSVLAGNPSIAPALSGDGADSFNGTILAIDPRAFGNETSFQEDVLDLAQAIHHLEPSPGIERIFLPGERGHETARARSERGIPLAPGTVKRLLATAAELGVPVPSVLKE